MRQGRGVGGRLRANRGEKSLPQGCFLAPPGEVSRVEELCALPERDRLSALPELGGGEAKGSPRRGVLRLRAGCGSELRERVLTAPEPLKRSAKVEPDVRVTGREPHRLRELTRCILYPTEV